MKEWIVLSLQPAVVRRALKFALVVGAILIVINYGDVILNGTLTIRSILKMALTVTVPYFVSTLSSVGAIRQGRRKKPD